MTAHVRKIDLKGERRDVEGEQEKRTGFSIIHTLMLPHLEQTHWPNGTPCVLHTRMSPSTFENFKCKGSQRGEGKSNNRYGCLLRNRFKVIYVSDAVERPDRHTVIYMTP